MRGVELKNMAQKVDVYKPTLRHYLLVLPIFIAVRLLIATVRFRNPPATYRACSRPQRLVGVAWHKNIIFLAKSKVFYRPKIDMAGLVSASKDAAYLVAFFDFMGIKSVRGSRGRRGREAILDLSEVLKNKCDVFITPDGPKGPACVAKKGFETVAEIAGVRLVLMRFKPRRYFALPSWDGFIVPMPFTRVDVEALSFESVDELRAEAAAHSATPEDYVTDFLNFKKNA